jgi:hypothetical protein
MEGGVRQVSCLLCIGLFLMLQWKSYKVFANPERGRYSLKFFLVRIVVCKEPYEVGMGSNR